MALTAVNDGGSRGRPVPGPVKATGSDRPQPSTAALAAGLSGGTVAADEARLPAFSELLANILGSQDTGGQRPEVIERSREHARSREIDRDKAGKRERSSIAGSSAADRGEGAARERAARSSAEGSQAAGESEVRSDKAQPERTSARDDGDQVARESSADRSVAAAEAADEATGSSQGEAVSASAGDGTGRDVATATQQVAKAAISTAAVPVIPDSLGQQLATGKAVATASATNVATSGDGQATVESPLGTGSSNQQLQADVRGGLAGQEGKLGDAASKPLVDVTVDNAKQGPSVVSSLAQQVAGEGDGQASASSLRAAQLAVAAQSNQAQDGQGNPSLTQAAQVEAGAVPGQTEDGGSPTVPLSAQNAAAKAVQATAGRVDVSAERVETGGPSRAEVTTPPLSVLRRGDSSAGAARMVDLRPAGTSGPNQSPILERVRIAIAKLQAKGGGSAKIVLHPPKLGTLKIQVQARDGVVWARFEPDSMAARHVLVQNQDVLRDALGRQGLELGGFEVSAGGADGQGEDPLAQSGAQADQAEDGAEGSGQTEVDEDSDDPGGGSDGGDRTGAASDGSDRPVSVNLVA